MGKFSIEAIFKATDRFTRPIAKMSSSVEQLTRKMSRGMKETNSVIDSTGKALAKLGLAAVAAGTVVAAGLSKVIGAGADFEHTMVAAAAKFDPAIRLGTDGFSKLSKTAQTIGSTTEFSSTQAAAALKDLASAGFNAEQAMSALPKIVDLATAAEVDLATASDIAGKSLGAFNLKTDDAVQLSKNLAQVTDVMQKTANATSASMEGLFESIKEGAPVATSAGVRMETFMALAGQLSQAGIEGSVAGTTLKNMFIAMAAPTSEASKALKGLGIQTKTLKGDMRDPIAILEELRKKTDKMGSATKAGTLEAIFGRIPLAGVSALLTMTDKTAGLREQLDKASGSTAEMAKIMRGDTTGAINSFSGALDAVNIAIFEQIKEPLGEIVKGVTEWVRANKDLIGSGVKDFIASIRDALPTIVDVLERAGRAAVPLLAVAAAVKVWSIAQWLLNAAMTANPITLWIIGLTAVAALIAAFWPEIKAGASAAWQWIVDTASSAWNAVSEFASSAFARLKSILKAVAEFIVGALLIVFPPLRLIPLYIDLISRAANFVMDNWGTVTAFFSALWSTVTAIFSGAWSGIVSAASAALDAVKAVWAPIGAFFSALWSAAAETFTSAFGWVLDKITRAVSFIRGVGAEAMGEGDGERPPLAAGEQPQLGGRDSTQRSESVERVDLRVHGPATVKRAPPRGSNLQLSPSGGI